MQESHKNHARIVQESHKNRARIVQGGDGGGKGLLTIGRFTIYDWGTIEWIEQLTREQTIDEWTIYDLRLIGQLS